MRAVCCVPFLSFFSSHFLFGLSLTVCCTAWTKPGTTRVSDPLGYYESAECAVLCFAYRPAALYFQLKPLYRCTMISIAVLLPLHKKTILRLLKNAGALQLKPPFGDKIT